jgi:hypothetical protein
VSSSLHLRRLHFRQRIKRALDVLQVLILKMQIDERGLDASVAEEFFDGEEIGAGF